jgi:eukaryotic-like serine/threonine-protein kinase
MSRLPSMSANSPGVRWRCPTCAVAFRTGYDFCPSDGAPLVAWTDENDPLIGSEIAGRYVIDERVGEGSTGLVYRAHHPHLLRKFAVKILFGELVSDPRMRMRFAQEAALASQLNHPNVVSVVDFGRSEQGLLYLVMDYVEGKSLSDVIRAEAPLDPLRVVRLARQLACGLGHAHEHGLVHRDFKPGNVILEQRGDEPTLPRILDFGLAISTRETAEAAARLTECGYVVGTPVYIAPEQMLDHPVDRRTDLFAFGVVLYEMLSGKSPFDGSPTEIAQKNLIAPVEPIGRRSPGVAVPAELERLVFRLLEKQPDNRPASTGEVCAALDALEEQIGHTGPRHLPAVAGWQSSEWRDDGSTDRALPQPARSYARLRARLTGHGRRWIGAAGAFVVAAAAFVYAALDRVGPTASPRIQPMAAAAGLPVVDGKAVSASEPPMVPPPPPVPVVAALPEGERPRADSSKPSRAERPRPAASRRSDSPRRVARAERTAEPAAAPEADPFPYKDDPFEDGNVIEFIREYEQVGDAIAGLQASRGESGARPYRERYGRLPYAEALRTPAVRRDARAELTSLGRDVRKAMGRTSPR